MTKDEVLNDGLVVTVTGRANRGKTTVARLIEEALREAGFTAVQVVDPGDETRDKPPIAQRVQATKKRPVLVEVKSVSRPVNAK